MIAFGPFARLGFALAVTHAAPTVSGALNPAIVRAVVTRHTAPLEYCYLRVLDTEPTLQGKVEVTFTIEADGRVVGARVESSTLDDRAVEGCLVARFRTMLFPQPSGAETVTQVRYPLFFETAGAR